jgi:hypothetical protein
MVAFQQLLAERAPPPLAEHEPHIRPPYSRRPLLWTCILAGSICIGAWSSSLSFGLKVRSGWSYAQRQTVQTRSATCTGLKIPGDFRVPPGYILVGFRQNQGDCFAIFRVHHPASSLVVEPGGGVAEVFGPDGHLLLRFSAIAMSHGGWELIEYRRLRCRRQAHCSSPL